jgi:lipoate-protein ligase A
MRQARLLDMGSVPPLTSQAVYHGLAEAMGPDDAPVLILVRPDAPYISIGAHQELDKEVDTGYCARAGLPVYRRHVGGGAVLLDGNQLFFQFVVPNRQLPVREVERLFPHFIAPAVAAYRALGVAAEFRPINDIQVAGRKIGGTGAAGIGEATVMVGSFMRRFDSDTMARALKVSSEKFRDKLRTTLEEYVTSMERLLGEVPGTATIAEGFAAEVERAFGWELRPDAPGPVEQEAIAQAERDLDDPEWLHQKGREFVPGGVKIQADTHLTEGSHKAAGGLLRATLLAGDGRVRDLLLSGDVLVFPEAGLERLAAQLVGLPLAREALTEGAREGLQEGAVQIPGVTPEDLAEAILAACHD